ncbi:hypothetical protein QFZ82_000976 [Streptomyces sp. V4I23]|uniref:hypothetical protein n=1 Tax=Streptomyces sp. V4I23 TaxID=3042282 RepID=UPI00278B8118|nr:hypothetical protein [Streptomyces sp. V4I23]MDQ1006491.1 hypothetical protein [Streptomyces sp. V4I23]
MRERTHRALAAALPSVLLGVLSLLLSLAGTAPGPQSASPGPAARAMPAAAQQLPAVARAGAGGAETVRAVPPTPPGPEKAVQHDAAAEHSVRLSGAPPLMTAPVTDVQPLPLRGGLTAGPRQERAPPRDAYDPRHTRGPPSTRHS